MDTNISLRRVTLEDADILLEWRNDPLTRTASHNTKEIAREEHETWLKATLTNPNRQLYIAEEDNTPVGNVRADFDSSDGSYELSWTVSPQAQGRGIGKHMVALLASQIKGSIRAEIKVGNTVSARIAEHSGMVFKHEKDGVMYYRRSSVNE